MARNEHTPDDLDQIADEIITACERLRALAASMREAGMPRVLIHSSTHLNFHIPEVIQWAEKTEVDGRAQLRSFVAGLESKIETRLKYRKNQKLASAKKKAPRKPND